MSYADTQKAVCSSCTVTKDFSNYWVPHLYYKAQNGSFIDVKPNGGATIYYLQRSDPKDPEFSNGLLAFPEGLRMLAGNPYLRSYTDVQEQQAVSYVCLGVSGPETHEFPNQNCPSGLRSQIFFPSCWDGVNLDSPDHKSHMAYPSRYNSGECPPSHPKRFISLFYEVIWNTPDFADIWYDGHQPFVWSTGDTTGYGYHGDFVNGWDVPTLQKAVNECNADSGRVEDCHVFDFFTDNFAQGCKIPASIDEQVHGVLDALPGCNPIQNGPGMAKAVKGCGAPTTIGAADSNFVDLTTSKGFAYVGCGTDAIPGQARTLPGPNFSADDMTNEKCVDFCVSKGYSVAGTEYTKQCYCGNSIPSDRAPVSGLMGNCVMPCGGDGKEFCGGAGTISLYQKCGSTCQNAVFLVNNSTSGPGSPPYVATSGSTPSDSNGSPSNVGGSPPANSAASSPAAVHGSDNSPSSSSSTAAQADSGSNYGTQPSPVVVMQTQTVIPLESLPTQKPTAVTANAKAAAATVSISTVTVTTCMPQKSMGLQLPQAQTSAAAVAAGANQAIQASPAKASNSPVAVAAPASASSSPSAPAPAAAKSSPAPYGYSNGTAVTSAIGQHATGHKRHLHAHATARRLH
jgi:hypothetical protein